MPVFEQIGRRTDPEARKRDAMSAAITSLLGAAVVGFAMGLAAWQLGVVPDVLDDDPPMVEVLLSEPNPTLTEPELPQAKPSSPPISKGEEGPTQVEPDVDADPAPLTEVVVDTVVDTESTGHHDGTELGDADGEVDGTPGPGGEGDCENETCAVTQATVLHHSELSWRRQVQPIYPSEVDDAPDRVACIVSVGIDQKGVPQQVTVADCPAAFHEATRSALSRSRWFSPRVGGRKVAAQTTIRIVFVKNQGG